MALRWFLAVCLAAVCLLVIAAIIVTTPPGERALRGWLEGYLDGLTVHRVSLASLETNLLSRIQLDGLRIVDTTSSESPVKLHITHVIIEFNPWRLVHKELALTYVDLDTIEVSAERSADSSLRYPMNDFLAETLADTTASALTISIDSAVIRSMRVNVRDRLLGTELQVASCSMTAAREYTEDYRLALAVDSVTVRHDTTSIALREIRAAALWTPESIRLDTMHLGIDDITIAASMSLSTTQDTVIAGRINITGDPTSLLQAAGAFVEVPAVMFDGDVTCSIQTSGSLRRPVVEARVSVPGVTANGIHCTDTRLCCSWYQDTIRVDTLIAGLLGGSLRAGATLQVDSLPAGQLELALRDIDLAQVWSTIHGRPAPYQGRLRGNISLSGRGTAIEDWRVDGQLVADEIVYRNRHLPDLRTSIRLADGRGGLSIDQDYLLLESHVQMDGEALRGDFSLAVDDLKPLAGFFNIPGVTGRIHTAGEFSGSLENPQASVVFSGSRLQYQNFPLDTIAARLDYQDSVLSIGLLEFAGELTAIDPDHPPFEVAGLTGGLRYTGRASGTLDEPRGVIQGSLFSPAYNEFRADSAAIELTLEDFRISVSSEVFLPDQADARLQGTFGMVDSTGHLAVTLRKRPGTTGEISPPDSMTAPEVITSATMEFSLGRNGDYTIFAAAGRVNLQPVASFVSDSFDIGGILTGQLNFSGTVDEPQISCGLVIASPRFGEVTFDSLIAAVSLENQECILDSLKVYTGGGLCSVDGRVELQRDSSGAYAVGTDSRTRGTVQIPQLNLGILTALLPPGAELAGSGALDVQWNGTLAAPHAAGRLTVEDGSLRLEPALEPVTNIRVGVSLDDSMVIVDTASMEILQYLIIIAGEARLQMPDAVELHLTVSPGQFGQVMVDGLLNRDSVNLELVVDRLDLATLQTFLPQLDTLSGILNSRLEIRGAISAPDIWGTLAINGLAARPRNSPINVRGGRVQLTFDRNRLVVDTVFARMQEGTISLRGFAQHDLGQLTGLECALHVNNVKLTEPKAYTVHLRSAQLSYSTKEDYFLLDGDVEFGESRLSARFKPQAILPWAQTVEQSEPKLPDFLTNTRLDIRIRESNDFWVDNNLARLRLQTALRVIGSPAQPNFSGRVQVAEGYLLYLDRKFMVREGIVMFLDPNRLNPEIMLLADTKITSYRAMEATSYVVTISVEGTLLDPIIALTADPSLDKPDIVSLLTLGATRGQLLGKNGDTGPAGGKSAIVRRAEELASRQVSGYFGRKVGDLLGLDQVSVEGNLLDRQDAPGPRLRASKRISRRAEIEYSTTVGYLNDQSFRLNYQLSSRFALEGQTDQRGRSSANIKYRVLFR